jgi:hypothetical protein
MKFTTRQDATASIEDQDVPASAVVTSAIKLGTASFSVSASASSWATRASDGTPAKTVVATPAAPDVHPVPALSPGITPHWVAVFPMCQLQLVPGSIPAASTSATNVAIGGSVVDATTGAAGAGAAARVVGTDSGALGAGIVGAGMVAGVVAGVVVGGGAVAVGAVGVGVIP